MPDPFEENENGCEFDDGNIITHIDGLYDKLQALERKIDTLTRMAKDIESTLSSRR